MSTDTMAAPKNDEAAIIEQKKSAWGTMGVAIYKNELALQAKAQEAIQKIVLPAKIEDVPQAEALLKELKFIQQAIQEDRKKITSRFDDLSARLMQPEKSLTDPINDLAAYIIKIKKEYENAEAKKRKAADELKDARQIAILKASEAHSKFLSLISEEVQKAYAFALGDGDIKPAALDAYLKTVKGKLNVFDFAASHPTFDAFHSDQVSVNKTLAENFKTQDPSFYVQEFHKQLDDQFSDYDVAYENKKQALAFAEKEKQEKLAKIESQKQNSVIAAKLDSAAIATVPDTVGPVIKSLKQSFEVDMPETVQSAIKIMSAFVANVDQCLPKLKVNKWFAFTPAQAATALAKVKSDDNAFSPEGITFKTVDKL